MATSMASNFTSADRRKKVVTYGKSSRLSTVPTPAPASNEDAPSPERPPTHAGASNGFLNKTKGLSKIGDAVAKARAESNSLDVFDVPSDDEFSARPLKPTKKLPAKNGIVKENLDVPLAEDKAHVRQREDKVAIAKSRKPESQKPAAPSTKKAPKAVPMPILAQLPLPSSSDPIAPPMRRGRTPQPTQKLKQATKNENLAQELVEREKTTSRAIIPMTCTKKEAVKAKIKPASALKKASNTASAKVMQERDVFDVPLSDEELATPPRKQPRTGRITKPKAPSVPTKPIPHKPAGDTAESDDSAASRKRKRHGSASSMSTVKPDIERIEEPSAPQRSRKYPKKEESVLPGHEASGHQTVAAPSLEAQSAMPPINKPKRTRQRTVPMLSQPTMNKEQSSPATLTSMLPGRSHAKPSPISEAPESFLVEDDTMYDILDPMATPVRASKATASGSVTPRQKALFSSLLSSDSISTTPMPKIAALQLTDCKPTTLLGALSRSKSDLTYSAQARKTRLIDTLKPAETSSEDEDDDSVSSSHSYDKLNTRSTSGSKSQGSQVEPSGALRPVVVQSDKMDIDVEIAADSQTSQTTANFGSRPKFTYANARSYLEEANPEDALLISMDLDDDIGLHSQKLDGLSDDDEDPTSQIRAHHELKRRGQQTSFDNDLGMFIDDLRVAAGNTVRRSAILELCTRMEDNAFTSQLLESTWARKFFRNINSNGEIIFDFASAVAIAFILQADLTSVALDQIYQTGIIENLVKLASNETDVHRIAKDRKSNLSKIAQESIGKFRAEVLASSLWSTQRPEKLSPQLVALKALESLMFGLRRSGNIDPLLDQGTISHLIDIANKPCQRLKCSTGAIEDSMVLHMIFSILESVSVARHNQSVWSPQTLQCLADCIPVVLGGENVSSTMLAVKLCMNLTNNKPKACQPFSGQTFVQALMTSIVQKFSLLTTSQKPDDRLETLESLILSLGAMINLAEFSDEARTSVDDGKQVINALVSIYLEGSERAAQVFNAPIEFRRRSLTWL